MKLQKYNYFNNDVRIIVDESNELWFVAKDICTVLGLDTSMLYEALDLDDYMKVLRESIGMSGKNRNKLVPIINEPGFYNLVFKSRKFEAKQFKLWIRQEVIPSIRKTDMYVTEDTAEEMLNDPDAMIRTLEKFKEEQEKRLQPLETLELDPEQCVEYLTVDDYLIKYVYPNS